MSNISTQHEDVVKLFNISKSSSLSLALRNSALEQLVLLLQGTYSKRELMPSIEELLDTN